MKRKKVVVLGSTGSIGCSTLEVLSNDAGKRFKVELLVARSAFGELLSQVNRYESPHFYLDDPFARERSLALLKQRGSPEGHLSEALRSGGAVARSHPFKSRQELFEFLHSQDFDICLLAFADFEMSSMALEHLLGRSDRVLNILVASKEPMVVFGDRYRQMALKNNHQLIPLDSEPSAIFQCLNGSLEANGKVETIYLTASGGPFYRKIKDRRKITPRMALKHPVWKMGKKITVDSATLLNKALELMEINNLFSIASARIKILVHPQCVIHSMVAMRNGSILAQLGHADMKIPIHFGLHWPDGFRFNGVGRPMDFASSLTGLTFEPPPLNRLPCLKLGLEVARIDKKPDRLIARSALLGADDSAVERFLSGDLSFEGIPALLRKTIERSLAYFRPRFAGTALRDCRKGAGLQGSPLNQGLTVYRWAREFAQEMRIRRITRIRREGIKL